MTYQVDMWQQLTEYGEQTKMNDWNILSLQAPDQRALMETQAIIINNIIQHIMINTFTLLMLDPRSELFNINSSWQTSVKQREVWCEQSPAKKKTKLLPVKKQVLRVFSDNVSLFYAWGKSGCDSGGK